MSVLVQFYGQLGRFVQDYFAHGCFALGHSSQGHCAQGCGKCAALVKFCRYFSYYCRSSAQSAC